jgi:hypothetical protein
MGNWAFEIDRADNYIIDLTASLTDEGFRIWCLPSMDDEFPPLYLFSSAYLNHLPNDKLYMQASQLVKFIDGLSYLLFENKNNAPEITFSNVIDRNTLRIASVPRSQGAPEAIDFSVYTPAFEEDENALSRLLKLVPKDPYIRDLLLTPHRQSEDTVFKVLETQYNINLAPYKVKERAVDWDYE